MKRQIVERSGQDMLNAFNYKLHELKSQNKDIESTEYVEASDYEDETWDLIARRDIKDADGFMTEYCLYESDTGRIVTVYGDSDFYRPENGDIDEEFESMEEAEEWFYNFDPFGDEEETW